MDTVGTHPLSCRFSAGRIPRHSALIDVVRRGLSAAGIPSMLEPSGLDRGDGKLKSGKSPSTLSWSDDSSSSQLLSRRPAPWGNRRSNLLKIWVADLPCDIRISARVISCVFGYSQGERLQHLLLLLPEKCSFKSLKINAQH